MMLDKPTQNLGKYIHPGHVHLPEKVIVRANGLFHWKLLDYDRTFASILGEILQKTMFEGIGFIASLVIVVDVEIPEYYWISPCEARHNRSGGFGWVGGVQLGEIFHFGS